MGYTLHSLLPSQRATAEGYMLGAMVDAPQTDAAMLALWEQWKRQLVRTLEASCNEISDLRHTELVAIEREILKSRAEGLHGLAIQLGLWRFNSHVDPDDVGHAFGLAALASLVALTGLDAKAEADALFTGEGLPADVVDLAGWRKLRHKPIGVELTAAVDPLWLADNVLACLHIHGKPNERGMTLGLIAEHEGKELAFTLLWEKPELSLDRVSVRLADRGVFQIDLFDLKMEQLTEWLPLEKQAKHLVLVYDDAETWGPILSGALYAAQHPQPDD